MYNPILLIYKLYLSKLNVKITSLKLGRLRLESSYQGANIEYPHKVKHYIFRRDLVCH
jgi:hypothetical protein